MIDQPDELVICLDESLQSISPSEEPHIFMQRVAESYLMRLVRRAHIPMNMIEGLRQDVLSGLHDLLRIRAYGFHSLTDYLQSQASLNRKPSKFT